MLIPRFVTRYLLSQNNAVKELLRALRRESLLIIYNYQFGLRQLEKFNWGGASRLDLSIAWEGKQTVQDLLIYPFTPLSMSFEIKWDIS